ncbi:energy-coupling factor transporter ATPase [Thermincola potens]|uniref:Energy-coupling factor transporter ATP-binding protein EcfA2 n=1 Tax=Thermincola potens (strain JR) TaxID=635013 RepID=D5XAB5_THEPJ|nr:energy-coupling factor transporter ATPase [Thermincola potens]ADG81214.1 ABC transporter related protein [Thermincola potens JR]
MHIETRNLSHIYAKGTAMENKALTDVNVTIERGTWTAIVGSTGSGKSTFIQHLNGLLKPTSGQVLINGKDINAKGVPLVEVRRTVGLVFQYPEHQIFETTVYNEVAYGPRNLGFKDAEVTEAVRTALEKVGLDYGDFKDRSPLELSGGEKRKVAIASVLAMRPQIMVLDEATAGLDPCGRERLLREIARLKKDLGLTIVWVTHNLNEVLTYADKVIVFHKGRLALQGKPMEVFSQVELCEKVKLGVPQLLELEYKLKARGLKPPNRFTTLEEAKKAIANLLRGENR